MLSVISPATGREQRKGQGGRAEAERGASSSHGGDRPTRKPAGQQRKALTAGAYGDFIGSKPPRPGSCDKESEKPPSRILASEDHDGARAMRMTLPLKQRHLGTTSGASHAPRLLGLVVSACGETQRGRAPIFVERGGAHG